MCATDINIQYPHELPSQTGLLLQHGLSCGAFQTTDSRSRQPGRSNNHVEGYAPKKIRETPLALEAMDKGRLLNYRQGVCNDATCQVHSACGQKFHREVAGFGSQDGSE